MRQFLIMRTHWHAVGDYSIIASQHFTSRAVEIIAVKLQVIAEVMMMMMPSKDCVHDEGGCSHVTVLYCSTLNSEH